MRTLVLGAAAAAYLGMAGAAMAGGLYEGDDSMKDTPAPMPVAIWSGLYVGGTVGFGTGDTSGKLDFKGETAEEVDWFRREVTNDFVGLDNIESLLATDYDVDGAVYGAFVGYNWQHGNKVFGIEAGLNGTDFDGHTKCALIADCNRELDYYARVVGRLGYAVDKFLFYGFGGVAWGDVETDVDLPWGGFTGSETHVGWTGGVGIEMALTERFFVGVEYAHVDLGEESFDVEYGNGGIKKSVCVLGSSPCGGASKVSDEVDMDFDVIKIRASYKLWDRAHEPLESYK